MTLFLQICSSVILIPRLRGQNIELLFVVDMLCRSGGLLRVDHGARKLKDWGLSFRVLVKGTLIS